jgi:HPt (histidine-containing phosphotransfer) domain-containing protein
LEKWLPQRSLTIHHESEAVPQTPEHPVDSLQSPASAQTASSPLDTATLADLRQLGGDEDPSFFISVIEQFCTDSVTHMEGIILAIRENNSGTLNKVAHALKGCSRTIGAKGLADIAFQLEQMGQTNNLKNAQAGFVALQSEFDRVQTALQDEVRQSSPTLS